MEIFGWSLHCCHIHASLVPRLSKFEVWPGDEAMHAHYNNDVW